MVSVNFQNYEKVYQFGGVEKIKSANSPTQNASKTMMTTPSFKADSYRDAISIRTTLATKEEKKQYNEIVEVLDSKYKKKLDYALKSGILLKNDEK